MHVRRGDYLTIHDGLFHTPCNLKYYRQAMEMFPNVDFLFFSDDVGWCKENFKAKNIKYSDSNNSMVDFAMITLIILLQPPAQEKWQ